MRRSVQSTGFEIVSALAQNSKNSPPILRFQAENRFIFI